MFFAATGLRASLFAVFPLVCLFSPSHVHAAQEISCAEGPAPTVSSSSHYGLRDLGMPLGVRMGSAVNATPGIYRETAVREFSVVTPENAMKWNSVHPKQDVYAFCDPDEIVRFARENGMLVRGHTLAWDGQNPAWLVNGSFTRDQMVALLHDHISTVVGHFKAKFPGTVYQWDVVNEPIQDCSPSPGDPLYQYYDRAARSCVLRRNIWQRKIGDDYIALALRFAHDADPEALLYVNEYGTEPDTPGALAKRKGLMNLVTSLRAAGVPIHGIGLQFHIGREGPPPATLNSLMSDVASWGVEVAVTELDVAIGAPSLAATARQKALARQALTYRQVLDACLGNAACHTFVVWGFTDAATWLSPDQPCIFDKAYLPKPAYIALLDRLLEESKPSQPGDVRSSPH